MILQTLPEEQSRGLITPRIAFAEKATDAKRCYIYPDVAMILYQHLFVLLLLW